MKYYHVSKRILREGTILTVGVYGERIRRHDYIENQYKTYIKEEIFESLRSAHYPELPSRLDCVFLFSKEEEAMMSYSFINAYKGYVYEVEIRSGKPLEVEMDLLHCDGRSYREIQESAHKYWKGIKHKNSASLEVLLCGEALVRKLVLAPSILGDL